MDVTSVIDGLNRRAVIADADLLRAGASLIRRHVG
jgi:hypothetical protein